MVDFLYYFTLKSLLLDGLHFENFLQILINFFLRYLIIDLICHLLLNFDLIQFHLLLNFDLIQFHLLFILFLKFIHYFLVTIFRLIVLIFLKVNFQYYYHFIEYFHTIC